MRITLPTIGLAFAVAAAVFAQDAPNKLTRQEKKDGWKLLFDGKSLKGWTPRATSAAGETGNWTVAGGAIVCPGTSAGWLSSPVAQADYVLKLDFRGAANVNSGVFLRSQAEGQPHVTGYELQIWDFQPAGFNTGSLVGSLKASPTRIAADNWNRYEITAKGDHYKIVLNGSTLLDGSDAKHTAAGLVGFQCQKNNKIEFRNVKLLAK
jgi:hypothetical protein